MTATKRLIPALFVFLWATGFIGARYAMPWAEPFSFLAVRGAITLLIFAIFVVALRRVRMSLREVLSAAVAGVLMHGIYLGGVFWAIRHGMPAGLSALIVGLQPLITAILAGKILGEAVLPRHWVGLAAGFLGVALVLAPKLAGLDGGITPATLGASFIAVVGMSAGTIWQKRFLSGADLFAGTFWQYAGATVFLGILAFSFETGSFTLNADLVFAMAWLVLVLSVGAIVLLMVMIRDGEVARVASLFYLVPAVTAVIAWILFGEELNAVQLTGMALTTFGVALAVRRTVPAA